MARTADARGDSPDTFVEEPPHYERIPPLVTDHDRRQIILIDFVTERGPDRCLDISIESIVSVFVGVYIIWHVFRVDDRYVVLLDLAELVGEVTQNFQLCVAEVFCSKNVVDRHGGDHLLFLMSMQLPYTTSQ